MKLICGPMATISHPAFRILVEKFGCCDEYFTEMINAGTLLTKGPFEKYYIDPAPVPEKVVWQMTGRDNGHMEDAARLLVELPGIGLDINMGCSAPDIYRFGAGIGWMLKDISETEDMIKRVGHVIEDYNNNADARGCPEQKKRFSVKLRLGDDNFTDDQFFSFTDMLVNNGVELLTLHPRTKKEKLTRPARYEYCQKLCERYHSRGVKIYLNGNIRDYNSAKAAVMKAPDVDGIMISRESVRKPWIFYELHKEFAKASGEDDWEKNFPEKSVDMFQLGLDYIDDVEKYQPEEFWKTRLQRFFTYYSDNFLFGHYAQTQFINAKDIDDLRGRLKDFFEKCPDERIKNF